MTLQNHSFDPNQFPLDPNQFTEEMLEEWASKYPFLFLRRDHVRKTLGVMRANQKHLKELRENFREQQIWFQKLLAIYSVCSKHTHTRTFSLFPKRRRHFIPPKKIKDERTFAQAISNLRFRINALQKKQKQLRQQRDKTFAFYEKQLQQLHQKHAKKIYHNMQKQLGITMPTISETELVKYMQTPKTPEEISQAFQRISQLQPRYYETAKTASLEPDEQQESEENIALLIAKRAPHVIHLCCLPQFVTTLHKIADNILSEFFTTNYALQHEYDRQEAVVQQTLERFNRKIETFSEKIDLVAKQIEGLGTRCQKLTHELENKTSPTPPSLSSTPPSPSPPSPRPTFGGGMRSMR